MGISLIIPGADFAGSPLGQVTFKKSTEEIVTEYLDAVGADNTNKEKLKNLYYTLNSVGALETLDLFPMLGDTLAHRTIGLKPSGDEYVAKSLLVGDNASLDVDGGIAFADSNPNFTGSESGYINKKTPTIKGLFFFLQCSCNRAGRGVAQQHKYGELQNDATIDLFTENHNTGSGFKAAVACKIVSKTDTYNEGYYSDLGLNQQHIWVSHYNNGMKQYLMKEDQLVTLFTQSALTNDTFVMWLNNMFGGYVGNPDTHFFNSNVKFFAVGVVTNDNFNTVVKALTDYCS